MRRMYSEPQLLKAVENESAESGIKVFENIKDKDGHYRFIEGDITLSSSLPSGITLTFGKWALSGSHLLIVVAGDVENGTVILNASTIATVNLPDWIKAKIYPMAGNYIDYQTFYLRASDFTSQSLGVSLQKVSDVIRLVQTDSTFTASKDRGFRFAFDLLIDNE